jgi:hypothetical protein
MGEKTGYGTGTACARGQMHRKGKTSPWFMLLVVAQVPPCRSASARHPSRRFPALRLWRCSLSMRASRVHTHVGVAHSITLLVIC